MNHDRVVGPQTGGAHIWVRVDIIAWSLFPHIPASPRMHADHNSFRLDFPHKGIDVLHVGQVIKAERTATMPSFKIITIRRSTLVLAEIWILLNQASNSDAFEALSLSSLGQCSPLISSSDINCGKSLDYSTPTTYTISV